MLSRLAAYIFVGLLFSVVGADANDFSKLKGSWICQSGCSCTPASPHRYTSITANGTARNECGAESALIISSNRVRAKDWNDLQGTLSADNGTIQWDNGSAWAKLADSAPDLERLIGWWESRAFYCPSQFGAFPSKEGDNGAPECGDGDSVMFNALLCRSGDPRGCNAVKLSQDEQDENGRFWRSPRKHQLRPEEPSELDDAKNELKKKLELTKESKGETTFSGDHATGLFVYFGHTQDQEKDSFQRWIRWIASNERCQTLCGDLLLMPAGTPRFCKNDRCAFGPGDCQMLVLLGRRMGVGVPFCSVDGTTPIPTVENVAQAMKNTYDETLRRLPVQDPALKALRDNFDKALRLYQEAIAPIEKLRTQIEAEAVKALMLTQIINTVSLKVNKRGFSRHNSVVRIMTLQDWGLGRSLLSKAVSDLVDIGKEHSEPLNPFFQYVAHRRTSKESMLPLIREECPSEVKDNAKEKPHIRRQWSWERATDDKAWNQSMYWDCLFIAAMYSEKTVPPPDGNSKENALRASLEGLREEAGKRLQDAQAALKTITDWKNPLKAADPTTPIAVAVGTTKAVKKEAKKKCKREKICK